MCGFILALVLILIWGPTILMAIDCIVFDGMIMKYIQDKAQDRLNEKMYGKKD